MASTLIRHNVKMMRYACQVLFEPGMVVELRAPKVTTSSWKRPHVVNGYFNDFGKLIIAASNITECDGVYVTLNEVKPALLNRAINRVMEGGTSSSTSDADMRRRRWLPIDLDPVRPSGISSTDAEHDAALRRALDIREYQTKQGWTDWVYADSGNGAHLLYRLDAPADDGGAVHRMLQRLDAQFSDNVVKVDLTTANPSRIWKLYGTVAMKGDSSEDRPHRLSRILEVSSRLEVAD